MPADQNTLRQTADSGFFDSVAFEKGNHGSRDEGLCVMEAAASFAGERHTDQPACASPTLTVSSLSR